MKPCLDGINTLDVEFYMISAETQEHSALTTSKLVLQSRREEIVGVM